MKNLIGLHFLGDDNLSELLKKYEKEFQDLLMKQMMVPYSLFIPEQPSNMSTVSKLPDIDPVEWMKEIEAALDMIEKDNADRRLREQLIHELKIGKCAKYVRMYREGKMGKRFLKYLLKRNMPEPFSGDLIQSVDNWVVAMGRWGLIDTEGTSLAEYNIAIMLDKEDGEYYAYVVPKTRPIMPFTYVDHRYDPQWIMRTPLGSTKVSPLYPNP